MDLIQIRRKLLMSDKAKIGYTPKIGYDSHIPPRVIDDDRLFLTGFIPYVPTTTEIRLQGWHGRSDYDSTVETTVHFIVMYNAEKELIDNQAYWNMMNGSERTVATTKSIYVENVRYLRFCGVLTAIDLCYLKDYATGEILWQKGM